MCLPEIRGFTIKMDDTQKTMKILIETERVADQIIQNKHEIVMLDKRRQDTREALRDLGKSDQKKAWITIGSLLVKMNKDKALELLKKGLNSCFKNFFLLHISIFFSDQIQIDVEINKLRSDQKVLVCKHRDLEYLDPLKGHDLQPLSSGEINAFKDNLPGF